MVDADSNDRERRADATVPGDDCGNELFEAITRIAQLRPVCPGPEVDPGAWCKRDSLSPTANGPSLVCAQVARSRPAGAPQAS